MIGRLRLWSGLVLFVYASLHLTNHVLGVVSIELLEQGRQVFDFVWRNPPGTVLLYGAFTVHVSLVLWSLFQRRRLRLSRAEWTQLVLGLSIVPLGAIHFVGTRFAHELYDTRTTYGYVLLAALAGGPVEVLRQLGLVLVVWVHGCIGLHRSWKLKAWYASARAWLLGAAVALPCLALAGSIAAMADYEALRSQPDALRPAISGINPPDAAGVQHLYTLADGVRITGAVLVVLVLVARRVRNVWQRRAGVVTLAYAGLNGGLREVSLPVGPSVLEISRHFGIPHASVCGGRGRCSTCRVRIRSLNNGEIPPASAEEQRVLQRIDAPEGVRLACQLRLSAGQYRLTPLLPASASAAEAWRPQGGALGRERLVAVLFCDLRGFTSLAEGRLPYDIVFILNRYFRAVGEAVSAAGGRLDKFIGDGAMALFGPGLGGASDPAGPREAARQALDAARRIAEAVDHLNTSLSGDLERPLRLGIGVHAGPAIIGEMGWGPTVSLTAIGDTVNTASRLESATKELACELVVSAELLAMAELPLDEWPEHLIEVRGRQGRLTVRAVKNAAQLVLAQT